MTTTGLIKPQEMDLPSKTDFTQETSCTNTTSTIFCDMVSPEEWKSSLSLGFKEDDILLSGNSPSSPSNSIEDIVLEMDSTSQDTSSDCQDSLLFNSPNSKFDDLLNGSTEVSRNNSFCHEISSVVSATTTTSNNEATLKLAASSGTELQKGKTNLRQLRDRLAKVVHCNSPDDVNVLQKAKSTISTLRQQACDLMSSYSELKFNNDELLQRKTKLQSGRSNKTEKGPLTIELLIPCNNSEKEFDSSLLYHHIPIEDSEIPEFPADETRLSTEDIVQEPYEEQYDTRANSRPIADSEVLPCQDKKLACELGCICSSLDSGKLPAEHCKNPDCMLESSCSRSEDPSHTPKVVYTIMSKWNPSELDVDCTDPVTIPKIQGDEDITVAPDAQVEPPRPRKRGRPPKSSIKKKVTAVIPKATPTEKDVTTEKEKRKKVTNESDQSLSLTDPKLLQNCCVRIRKLDIPKLTPDKSLSDPKLRSVCIVPLFKTQIKVNQAVYCMDHKQYNCTCLPS